MWWHWIEVESPADAAWEVLVDLDRWPEWGPTVTEARTDTGARRLTEGASGAVRTAVGVWVPFEVTTWQEGEAWGWRVAGIPATEHRVESMGPSRARVGMGVPRWAPAYIVVVAIALRRVARAARRP